mgnify:CR=1 FL=1
MKWLSFRQSQEVEMADESEEEIQVPEGTALFPDIPDQLGVNPLLLSLLSMVVFLAGSDEAVVNENASAAVLDQVASYLQRLSSKEISRLKEDLAALANFAREEKWGQGTIEVLESFFDDMGVGEGE